MRRCVWDGVWAALARAGVFGALLTLAGVGAGCWETPSQEWYDAGLDGGAPDGGCDAACCGAECCDGSDCGVPDVGTPRVRERVCGDGLDNDDDGLEDCADFDCASYAACCADGALLFQEDWTSADLTFLWNHLPSVMPTSSPMTQTEDGTVMLSGWPDAEPHALAFHRCIPLALGAELSFDVIATARDSVCAVGDATGHEPCDRYAAVVLSPVRDTALAQPLFEDLAIRVHGDVRLLPNTPLILNHAMVRVTQGGEEKGRLLIDPEVRYRATVRVTPSVQGAFASLRADLELRRADAPMAEPAILSDIFITRQAALVTGATGCAEVGGLYAAVEMVGDGARLGPLRAEALECANPSQFQTAPMGTVTLTSDSLGVPDSYGGAHVGSPSLGSSFNNASDTVPRWDLFFEATNDLPELALFAPVGHAIAHARTGTFGALPADWTTSSTPRLGSDPPSCLVSGSTCSGPSVRDPFLLLRRTVDDVLQDFTLAFAAARPEGSHELRVEENVSFSPSAPLGGSGVVLMSPDAACVDLRDPSLVAVEGGSEGFWLFFTCVPSDGVSEIRAARLDNVVSLRSGTEIERVVAPAAFGALAAGGVFGAEPIVRSGARGLTLQLWMVARDGAGDTSLVLVTGQLPTVAATDGGMPEAPPLETLPALEPYLANPVLRSDDPALGGCPGFCRITGLAVSDTAGTPEELRFVVARRVVLGADDAHSELVPLTQTWRTP